VVDTAKGIKSRLGQHQLDSQFGPADRKLKLHQTVGAYLQHANKPARDIAGDGIGGGWREGGHVRTPWGFGLAALDIAEAVPRWASISKMSIKQGFVLTKSAVLLRQQGAWPYHHFIQQKMLRCNMMIW
jgi:hypothetical protein